MHPVIKHIRERKNKRVPIDDGRKITLVLFGGVMAGISGAGAIVALAEMGYKNAFDRIYTYSAGFANASYFLTGEVHEGISIYHEDLCGKSFFNPLRFWKVIDIDYVIHVMKSIKPLKTNVILSQKTNIFVGLKNIKTRQIEYVDALSVPGTQYFKLLKATMSVPYLHPGSVTINATKYKDIGKSDIGIERTSLRDNPSDVLVIYNLEAQKKAFQYPGERVFEIMPQKDWQLSKYERDPEKLKAAAIQMGRYVKSLFGSQGDIRLKSLISS